MKGVIIAGGTGSRLRPLTKVINKNLLAIYDKPLIYYPILTLKDAGATNILIISGRGHAGQYLDLLGSGKELGVKLVYDVQEEPGGIAQALGIAKDFADKEKILALLGDNIFEDNFKEAVEDFKKQPRGSKIILKHVHDPERFGVAEVADNKILNIVEKPSKSKSNWAVTGLYMYDEQLWDIIENLKPSGRGELEITDVNNFYVKQGTMTYTTAGGFWIDAGTFDSLLKANILIAKKKKGSLDFLGL